ncbi:type I-B CRISPR-associated protein Cas8b/Csh1 [uncultured Clostridium sp.]|uniref:type I-B CRISPR-associated protein Cas8b/Csh1 n=1 Tax=uncultured Clostridium sp. TaxID=59620 RepID=UPI00321719FC
MLKECLESFKSELNEKGDKLILDNYVPADGTYIIVAPKDDSFEVKEVVNIKLDKKTRTIDKSSNYFSKLCTYDYNSKLVDINKPIDGKKIIHSNNYLSFFVKKESFSNGKLTNEIIDGYYDILLNPYIKYPKSKANANEVYKSLETEIGEVDKVLVEKVKTWIKENIFELGNQYTGKDYLKVFFEYGEDDYIREGKRYLGPNIYNSNDFNIKIDGEIFGLPNNNMGMNAKKPYLENKTRKVKVPYLIDSGEVMLQKKFFDYLLNEVTLGKVNIYLDEKGVTALKSGDISETDFEGVFIRIKKGKEVEILSYDVVTNYKPNLSKKFNFKNVLGDELDDKSFEVYGTCGNRKKMQEVLDKVFFSKYLINNYFTDAGDISINNDVLKSNLLISRDGIFNWLYKGNKNGIDKLLSKVSLNLVKGSIERENFKKAKDQFNLRWSFENYFNGGVDMAEIVYEMRNKLRDKINLDNSERYENFESDNEYYFAVGQLANYLLSLSKAKIKTQSLLNPILNAKNNRIIKDKLRIIYSKYNYKLDQYSKRTINLYGMIVSYEPEGKINQDMILAGYLRSNLVYEKDN